MPGAQPFRFAGGPDVGALLIHGFTGSPHELRPLGQNLADGDIASIGVLLRGHGTHPDDMLPCSYQDWVADVEAGLDELLARTRRAVLVGLSMGGTIALNIAARRANDPRLAGVVSLCAPLELVDWRLGFAWLLSRIVRWQAWGRPDIKDVSAWDRHVAYRRFRTPTVRELVALVRETRALLPSVRQPVLVIQSRHDHTVPPANADLIFDRVSSTDKRIVWLTNSFHVITVDFDAPIVNAEIARFIRERVHVTAATAPSDVHQVGSPA